MSMMPISPPNLPEVIPGHVVSTSCNTLAALFMITDYLNSTYDLQAADTKLEESVTNSEAQMVQAFEASLTAPYSSIGTNYLYLIDHLDPTDPLYTEDSQTLTSEYSNANASNQSLVKVMDGNNSTAQNTLSQNAQGQQGLMQTMSSINSIGSNLARLIQG